MLCHSIALLLNPLLLLFHVYQSLSVSLCAPPVISLPLLSSAQQNASIPCRLFALRLLALASQLESYLHPSIPFPLRSQRFHIIAICFLAVHFLCKVVLCSSVSVALHVRSNPYQINALPYLLKSVPVNSPPSQFIFTRIPSSPNVSAAMQRSSPPVHLISEPLHIVSPSCCAIAYQISAYLIRFAAFLRSSFASLFTIQGVLMPYLLSAF